MLCLQTYIFFFNNDTFSIFIFHLVHIKRGFVREWRARKRIEREEKGGESEERERLYIGGTRLERGADMIRERRGSGWREVRKKREKDKGTSEEKARDVEKRLRAILKNDDLCG